MEKRTIIAIAMSFLILIGFDYVYKKYFAPPEEPARVEESRTPETSSSPPASATESVEDIDRIINSDSAQTETPASASDTVAELQQVVVDTDLYNAVLENKGGVLISWILNHYKSNHGNVFDMVAAGDKGEKWPYPGSIYLENKGLSEIVNEEVYEVTVNGEPYTGSRLTAPVDVVMTLRRGDLEIRKTYSFHDENYLIDYSATVQKGGRELEGMFLLAQDIGPVEEYLKGRYTKLETTYFDSKKVKRESAPDKEDGEVTISGNIHWVGLDMHYFTAIAIPDKPISSIYTRGFEVQAKDLKGESVDRSLISVKYPFDGTAEGLMYLGPKERASLKAVPGYDLSGVIDYGMFSIIALPLLSALLWIHQHVNNFGLAIILLTLALSILLLPLRLKQMFSMKKMQSIQPKVKAIQEKYKKYKKTDPKRAQMNQEIMGLYKENKVNPMGGCLPLLVQFPLLFAFYRLLANSIELRQAPFIWWIKDLSAQDPYYVLPILMGITMFLSQKITPMAPTTDNQQAKMMQYLPVVFTIMFLWVSAGLNLYFLCSNIFQVGFQKIIELIRGDSRHDTKPKRRKK